MLLQIHRPRMGPLDPRMDSMCRPISVKGLCSARRPNVALDCGSSQWSARDEGNNQEGVLVRSAGDGELNNGHCTCNLPVRG